MTPPTTFLTKIIATVGPACDDVDRVGRLIEEGARVFRLNFSHGGLDEHARRLGIVRDAGERHGVPVAVLGDLRGPKLRIRGLADESIEIEAGDRVAITRGDAAGFKGDDGMTRLSVTYPAFVDEVKAGHRVLVDDGAIRMLAVEKAGDGDDARVVCNVIHGGTLQPNKGVNLPDSDLSIPSLTDFDMDCLRWAVAHELDYVALSFVRQADDVRKLRERLHELIIESPCPIDDKLGIPIVAKLETPQSIDDLDDILDASDAVMVARGDLGVEMDLTEVPVLQKRIIEQAHHHGKPVIVATQMLQSMITEASPTRAEVSDVANAILDGADAVMLSGETAVGAHPSAAVHTMAQTAELTESYAAQRRRDGTRAPRNPRESRYRTAALAHGVSVIVNDLHARYVVLWSELGGGARYLSQNRLTVPVIAVSSNQRALRRMALLFGVVPVYMTRPHDSKAFIEAIDTLFRAADWTDEGAPIVIVNGDPIGVPGVTNQIRIHYVGDVSRVGWRPKLTADDGSFEGGLAI